MRPTGLGIKAALFFAVLLAAFRATAYSNLFFLLLAALTVLAVCAAWWSARALRGLSVKSVAVAPSPVGTLAPVRIEGDPGKRDRLGMTLELEREDGDPIVVPVSWMVGETSWSGKLTDLPRGLYRITAARLATTAPFALFRTVHDFPAPRAIAIYPRPAGETEESGGGEGDEFGFAGAGASQPAGVREYRPGDDPRRIHWKASARRGEPVVQEWDAGRGSGFELVLDRRHADELETALSLVAAAAVLARESKETLTLHTQGHVGTYGEDQSPWDELWRFLAAADALPREGPPPPAASPEAVRLPREVVA